MKKRDIVIFDMDKTLLTCDSADIWYAFLEEKGILTQEEKIERAASVLQHDVGLLNIHDDFRREFSILNRISSAQKAEWQFYFFEERLKHHISPRAKQLLQQYQAEQAFIILSTAGMEFIATPVSSHIQADLLFANDGPKSGEQYLGMLFNPANYKTGKKDNFLRWFLPRKEEYGPVTFYTDSYNDLALLEIVDKPIAVNPDPMLHQHAQKNAWGIEFF